MRCLCLLLGLAVLLGSASINAETAKKFINSIGMNFVEIPAGEFTMGEDPSLGREGKADERPAHKVRISRPFYMGQFEVTQAQWRDVMGENPSRHKGDTNPVDSVSWNDVQRFIQKLNAREGHQLYRLPTEAEWEYAAKAGTNTRYFFGNEQDRLPEYAWITANAEGRTRPVGGKKPNQFGLYDTSGNVREWVNDWYDDEYYAKSPVEDPRGPSAGYGRAYRGGSKDGAEFPTRSTYRWRETPDTKAQNLGFRLVMTIPEE